MDRPYSDKEELANWMTHGIGLGLSMVGTTILLHAAFTYGTLWHMVSFAIYGCTLIILYLSSTFYHLSVDTTTKQRARIFDHAAIFLLIAGTYTPLLLIYLRHSVGWPLFWVIWSFAMVGIAFKVLFKTRYRIVSLALYLGMGWLCVIATGPILENVPYQSLFLLAAGGLFYTAGVVFYSWKSLPFHHAIWHLFVMIGSAFHYFSILLSAHTPS